MDDEQKVCEGCGGNIVEATNVCTNCGMTVPEDENLNGDDEIDDGTELGLGPADMDDDDEM